MTITDTSQRDASRHSPGQMIPFAPGAAGFVAIGLLMMTGAISIDRRREFDQVVGVAFFSPCLVVVAWRLLWMRGPWRRSRRRACAAHAWPRGAMTRSAVLQVWTREACRQKIVVISAPRRIEQPIGLNRMAGWMRRASRSPVADGLSITAAGLPVTADRLKPLIAADLDVAQGH